MRTKTGIGSDSRSKICIIDGCPHLLGVDCSKVSVDACGSEIARKISACHIVDATNNPTFIVAIHVAEASIDEGRDTFEKSMSIAMGIKFWLTRYDSEHRQAG